MKHIHQSIIFLFMTCSSLYGQNHTVDKLLQKLNRQDGCENLLLLLQNEAEDYTGLPSYWYYKGLCNFQQEHYSEAEQQLLKAESLGFQPRSYLYFHLSKCELKLNDQKESLNYIDKTLSLGLPPLIFEQAPFDSLKQNAEYNRLMTYYKPSLDKWTSLFLLIVFQGVLLFFILIFKKEGIKKANRLLSLFVLAFSIVLFTYVMYWSGYIWVSPFNYCENLFSPLNYVFGPLLLLYIQSLFPKKLNFKSSFYHFIPFAISVFILVSNHFLDGSSIIVNTIMPVVFNPWVTLVQMFAYLLPIYLFINKSRYHPVAIVISWMHYLMYAYFGFVMSLLSYYIFVQFSFFNVQWDYIISFMISVFIILISFMGYIQPQIFYGFKVSEILSFVKYEKSGLNESLAIELKQKLLELMVDEQVYKDNSINLAKLSTKLDTTKHNTSQIINEHFKENFFDFINDFRIDEAKELLIDDDNNMNISAVFYEVGFNNKVSFNNAFKKRTGLTPSQFRNNL